MKQRAIILVSLTMIILSANSTLAESKAAAAFDRLKSLVGEWQAKGADGKLGKVSYQLVSGGSALMEVLVPPDEPSMTSLYHLDGDKLMMTHYCSAGNQPRLRADVPAGEIKSLSFTFVDATNMTKSSDGHIHNLTITFQDRDHMTQAWTWRQDGKDVSLTYNLERRNLMSVPAGLAKLAGDWTGTNRLWLSPKAPVRESASTASLALVAQGQFVTLKYTWADQGKPQDGLLVIGQEKQPPAVKAVWIDSWHMGDKFMMCQGTVGADGIISVTGSSAATPGPDWGWRIVLEPRDAASFRLVMYNILPDGKEALAVETIYVRQP